MKMNYLNCWRLLSGIILLSGALASRAALDEAQFTTLKKSIHEKIEAFRGANDFTGPVALACRDVADANALTNKLSDVLASNDYKTIVDYEKNKDKLQTAVKDIATAVFPPGQKAVAEADPLLQSIPKHLKSIQGVDASEVDNWVADIAKKCKTETTYHGLRVKLINLFASDSGLTWLNYPKRAAALDAAAGAIAADKFAAPDAPSEKLAMIPITDNRSNIWGQVSVWTGAKFSNPYRIAGNQLTSNEDNTDAYVEINLSSRYIQRRGKEASDVVWGGWGNITPNDGKIHFVNPLAHLPDIDARIGYVFRNGDTPTNITASTIAGTSDFYSDGSIGLPVIRFSSRDTEKPWRQQVTLELGGGFATDKESLDLHPNVFGGLGWQASFMIATNLQGSWIARAGVALIDQPVLLGNTNTVLLNSLGDPQYDLKLAPTLGVMVTYPLTPSISFQAGANGYFTRREPASWNVTVGVTLDLAKFLDALTK